MYEIETKDLLEAQKGNDEAMTKIIKINEGLMWSIIKRFLGRGYEAEELYQIACIGFIKAIKRFDVNFEVKLSTYAVPYILGEIKRFIRDDGLIKVSRSLKELYIKVKEIQNEYLNKNGYDINIEEISKILKVSKEEIAMCLDSANSIESIDKENYEEDNNGETKISKIGTGKDETQNLVNKICLTEIINKLEEREKKIIVLRYYRGKTQSEVAKLLGISQVQVSRIEKKVLLNMREKIS